METTVEDDFEKKKKRKWKDIKENKQKLLTGENVEVRSTEEGFGGSWHSATIIACRDSGRHVKYNHLLVEDGSEELKEWIKASLVIDGIVKKGHNFINYRGLIRPVPPSIEISKFGLHYGLCVDALVNDAWWEGVIFDYEDGSLERSVFFPDLGDQGMIKIDELRITQDWDEVKETWRPRGNWVFLELIEEFDQEWPIVVSVKQIWYELRVKEGFINGIKEWTCFAKSMWVDLVSQTIRDNLELTAEKVLNEILSKIGVNLADQPMKRTRSKKKNPRKSRFLALGGNEVIPNGQEERTQLPLSVLVDPVVNLSSDDEEGPTVFKRRRRKISNSIHVILDNQVDECINSGLDFSCYSEDNNLINSDSCNLQMVVNEPLLSNTNGYCDEVVTMKNKDPLALPSDLNLFANVSSNSDRETITWLPPPHHLLPGAEYCPEAVENYLNGSFQSKRDNLALQLRMHLSYLGWKIEWRKQTKFHGSKRKVCSRFRYTSPKGETTYDSLHKICKLIQTAGGTSCSWNGHETTMVDAPVYRLSSSPQQVPISSFIEADQGCASLPSAEPLDSGISDREVALAPIIPVSDKFAVKPENIPQAVIKYYELQKGSKKAIRSETADLLRKKAKEQLLALGWKFSQKGPKPLYCSPTRKIYYSLFKACEGCKKEGFSKSTIITRSMGSSTRYKSFSGSSALMRYEVMENALPISWEFTKGYTESSGSSQSKENLEVAVIQAKGPQEDLRSRNYSSHGKATTASFCRKLKKKKKGSGYQLDGSCPTRVLRSSKRARQVVQSPGHHTPRTVLSWLIENNVVLPRAKVRYLRRKDDQPLAEGRVTRDGIKCNCCQKVFSLSSFEAHAGSKLRRPYASIFLEDGRSLLDCQRQVVQDDRLSCSKIKQCEGIKSNQVNQQNDYICSVCHYGGTLVLCDQCPSSFHLSCLGLEDLPDGKWFCPSCQCGICGQSEFHGDFEQSTENTVLCCDQCNREYHVGCIRKRGLVKPERYPESNWFCSDNCEQICEGLHNLLGKSAPVGVDNLSWTILKTTNDVYHRFGASDTEALIEHQSKLNVALGLMHECFEPIKDPHTRRDLIKDVLFNNMSELNRLNFRGFYTVLLEREDELISVATVRVHGEKVAEVPLVGTRVQYRRQGMCRILFDVLEKKLRELGVERLLLPAVPQVLHAWTTSFGFSKMTNSERLEFLEYTFLDFQDTTMCQKILRTIPAKCTEPRGNQPKLVNGLSQSKENIYMNRHHSSCEVAEVEHSQIVEQQPVYVAVENGSDSVVTAPTADLVTILDDSEENQQNSELCIIEKGLLKCSDEKQQEERGLHVKYYKRRRIEAS